MRRAILIISFLSFSTLTNGQTFAPIGAQWYYSASGNGSAPTASEYYHYQSQLDTVVAGHTCKKISVTYYQYSGAVSYPSPIFTYQTGDTVFYYNTVYAKYFPLYIFNVSYGDILTFHSPYVPYDPADTLWQTRVTSVTSFIVGVDTLKRVTTTDLITSPFSYLGGYYELFGCPSMMLPQFHNFIPERDGPLRCYSDSVIAYNFSTFPCDSRWTNEINALVQPFGLLVYPNPCTDKIIVHTNSFKRYYYNIYNAFGQLSKSGILETDGSTIYIPELTKGFYSIELSGDNKTYRQRFTVE